MGKLVHSDYFEANKEIQDNWLRRQRLLCFQHAHGRITSAEFSQESTSLFFETRLAGQELRGN